MGKKIFGEGGTELISKLKKMKRCFADMDEAEAKRIMPLEFFPNYDKKLVAEVKYSFI